MRKKTMRHLIFIKKTIVGTGVLVMASMFSNAMAANNWGEMLLKEFSKELQKGQSSQNQNQPSRVPTLPPQQRGSSTNSQVEPQSTSEVAIYNGPIRFSKEMQVSSSKLHYSDDEITFPLKTQQIGKVNVSSLKILNWPSVHCEYQSPSTKNIRTISYWYKDRPEIYTPNRDEAGRQQFIGWMKSYVDHDIAISLCPATWGEAMKVAWGEDAWSRKQAMLETGIEKHSKQKEADAKQKTEDTQRATNKEKPTAEDILRVYLSAHLKTFKSNKVDEHTVADDSGLASFYYDVVNADCTIKTNNKVYACRYLLSSEMILRNDGIGNFFTVLTQAGGGLKEESYKDYTFEWKGNELYSEQVMNDFIEDKKKREAMRENAKSREKERQDCLLDKKIFKTPGNCY